ncbi:Alcohol dehydrogenase [NADP(+)] [Tyrophagus putrescentiae]|nr:Alcohol dehydrogenase [NADP(+)] [Tyrophagus putrescentiae]
MSPASVPKVQLNDGTSVPILGLGTYEAPKGETKRVVALALKAGYRHLDCADFYENEDEVGEAIEEAIAGGLLTRDQLFVTTKVWPNWYAPGRPTTSIKRSLSRLRLAYVDLALVHWPTPLKQDDSNFYPTDESGQALFDYSITLLDVWKEFEAIKAAGLAKSIGVSNFNSAQIQDLIDHSGTVPSMNQVESHPFLGQQKLLAWCRSKGIALTAYSPLARTGTAEKKNTSSPLENEVVRAIANAHAVSPAQVCIRWQVQRGVIVIPKSATPARIEANFNVFSFALTEAEMAAMDGLNANRRNNTWSQFGINKHKDWPFAIEF